jgi:ParB-like chromosome segregation protein Spo0J
MSGKKKHLGRGLDALLGPSRSGPAGAVPEAAAVDSAVTAVAGGPLKELPVDLVQRGRYQPRRDIDPDSLQELADSIRAQGVMQPIVVRPVDDKRYEVADAVGKSRSTVANILRLMTLEEDVRRLVEHGDLEMGHARALLALPASEQSQAARGVVGKGLSVRQTEAMVRRLLEHKERPQAPTRPDPNIRHLQDDLSQRLGTKVQIQHGPKGRGKLVLAYNSLDELDGILSHIK